MTNKLVEAMLWAEGFTGNEHSKILADEIRRLLALSYSKDEARAVILKITGKKAVEGGRKERKRIA